MGLFPYGLYLDSKVLGTAYQIVSFYENKVFDRLNTIVYVKKYKQTAKKFHKIFSEKKIPYKFMKPVDLDALTDQIIFYPFNAQSNCRFVANRQLKHVFITHGESNKIASVKPIIRIYDYVVVSGGLSLERYINSKIFDKSDIDSGRFIQMGDTFIGKTGFSSDIQEAEPVLCYAPTWEGGLASENYSSVNNTEIFNFLRESLRNTSVNKLIIQPHPNTGYRVNAYIKSLKLLAINLAKEGVQVLFHGNNKAFTAIDKFQFRKNNIKWINSLNKYRPVMAFLDISSMETQFLNEGIPYRIIMRNEITQDYFPDKYKLHYLRFGVNLKGFECNLERGIEEQSLIFDEMKSRVIEYSDLVLRQLSLSERVCWLSKYILKR